MSFTNIVKYIKNLFNNDKKLKPLQFTVIIKNIKLNSKVLRHCAKNDWDAEYFDGLEYSGYYCYTKTNKNYTLAQHKDWCLKELQARYNVPDGLMTDCDCEVYLNYATIEDWKSYCNNDRFDLKTVDKRIF